MNLWTEVRECFDTDDGSLPGIEVAELPPAGKARMAKHVGEPVGFHSLLAYARAFAPEFEEDIDDRKHAANRAINRFRFSRRADPKPLRAIRESWARVGAQRGGNLVLRPVSYCRRCGFDLFWTQSNSDHGAALRFSLTIALMIKIRGPLWRP